MQVQRRAPRPLAGGAPSRKCQANAQRCAGLQGGKVQEAVCRRGCPANAHSLCCLAAQVLACRPCEYAAPVVHSFFAKAGIGLRPMPAAVLVARVLRQQS
jgi:hypothetical protein